jgi:glutathione S-transferase
MNAGKGYHRMSGTIVSGMVLRTTATSPFGRKVEIGAHVLGLMDPIRIEVADPWSEADSLRGQNPLGKMPVLVLADGTAVYDSCVILEYLDGLSTAASLIPADPRERLAALTWQALGDGMIDAGLLMTYETKRRPSEFCYVPWVDHQRGKIERALHDLGRRAPDPARPTVGSIAIACALGYLDWRKQVDWRVTDPGLVGWLDEFAAHVPAFEATMAAGH